MTKKTDGGQRVRDARHPAQRVWLKNRRKPRRAETDPVRAEALAFVRECEAGKWGKVAKR